MEGHRVTLELKRVFGEKIEEMAKDERLDLDLEGIKKIVLYNLQSAMYKEDSSEKLAALAGVKSASDIDMLDVTRFIVNYTLQEEDIHKDTKVKLTGAFMLRRLYTVLDNNAFTNEDVENTREEVMEDFLNYVQKAKLSTKGELDLWDAYNYSIRSGKIMQVFNHLQSLK